jgi:uncharacterized protein (DUF2141 family)
MDLSAKALRAALLGLTLAGPASGADLTVQVNGFRLDKGEIGCALFGGESGFPMDAQAARLDWQPATRGGVICRFADLTPGVYALAVSHDLNGNRKTDTNLLGMPTEDWGVSTGVRPSLRAPRFAEASFRVPSEGTRIAVTVAP